MPNYSELYSLPSVSALSLPHYGSGTLSYLNYSKPITRYPGVYKPHLSTISEINSTYRRLNTPKLTFPADISSRHNIKPIKVINTADIDVSVNKYKKYEKKSRLKNVETKNAELEQKESTPKPAIRRDRATVRIKTVHADTVKQEIGAFKTWRDNFEPNELVDEVKTRKKTKGEILKEKFLIRSRSKENVPLEIEVSKKNPIKKTSSFRDICTAITSENITDDLNPGQPVEVQRRQSKQLTSENLLKDIRRVSIEFTDEDFSLLNKILSTREEDDIPEESFKTKNLINDDNNIDIIEEADDNIEVNDETEVCLNKLVTGNDNNIFNENKNSKTAVVDDNNIIIDNTSGSTRKNIKLFKSRSEDSVSKVKLSKKNKFNEKSSLKCVPNLNKESKKDNFKDKTDISKPLPSEDVINNTEKELMAEKNDKINVLKSKIDITNVEIQEIKFKSKPIITSSVEDIKTPKKTLIAIVDNVEVQKTPAKIEKKLKFNVTVDIDENNKKIKNNENLQRASVKKGKLIHPVTKKYLENVFIQKIDNKQTCKNMKELKPVVETKSIPEYSKNEQIDIEKAKTNEENTKKSIKITSKRSLLNKSVKEDPDLMVFVPPPEEERQPETTEEKKDVFVPLQSNRLTQWMHPWVKPEQFDECPVEIFARPKVIRGRHYPRPRKRNSNGVSHIPVNSIDSNSSDSDDSSTEDTSASLRSNDSGFGSTVPEKINVLQPETITDKLDTSDNQSNIFVPPVDGKIIPPATTLPRFKKYCVEDFDFLKVIGKGSFGKVLLSKLKGTDYYYAVKCLKKDVIIEDDDVECTLIERKVLALGTKHPFLCHLLCTLQTESHLFFVMEYLNGGDLMFHITTRGSFPEDEARFYSAEIISGLQFLHSKGIIYRDLKLDNVLLDFDGHARLADFGMCQLQIFLDRMAESFCGTPDYMAPEIIKGQHYNQAVDWWSFGVLLYELFLGQSPFSGCDEDELFWSICNEKPVFPKHLSTYAIDLLTLLMEKDHTKRLGTRFSPHGSIRDHDFYKKLDWQALEARQIEPPFKPNVCHPLDTQYFDTNFTKETVKLSPTEVQKLQSIDQSQFQGFSYTNPNATDR
ncbi:uncharacterized protein LOC130449782 [Diorhabda sublineata]|uniref:uncharacterized protein LOC130449782 n=1 Tax=Diorhabda sublineata TaxID=1163346 RepID=UPI0024E041AA|nr:uncharacterized protein LOC130449782 [Diorhabda sublineata]